MSDAVSETSQQRGHSAVDTPAAGHGRHRGAASSSEETRAAQAAGPGRHRRAGGEQAGDGAAA